MNRENKIIFLELPQLSGKIAIVTGGSRGIGTEVVQMLLKCDMVVIVGMYSFFERLFSHKI
jgi:3-oxoacyl-ACP reductase-like protein